MTKQEQLDFMDSFLVKDIEEKILSTIGEIKAILASKGDDYANENRLSNFVISAELSQLQPKQICLVMISIKVSRLGVLFSQEENSKPKNEPIADSILDLTAYSILLGMLHQQKY